MTNEPEKPATNEKPATATETGTKPSLTIYEALRRVTRLIIEAGGVGKDRRNEAQRYNYRGIEDIMNMVAPCFEKAGVVCVPTYGEPRITERETKAGGVSYHVLMQATYTFVSAWDGTSVSVEVWGEAQDYGDKAVNKAMTAAYKYALTQVLAIPFDAHDNDGESPPETVRRSAPQTPAQPPAAIPKPAPAKRVPARQPHPTNGVTVQTLMESLQYEWADVAEIVKSVTGRDCPTYADAVKQLTPQERKAVIEQMQVLLIGNTNESQA